MQRTQFRAVVKIINSLSWCYRLIKMKSTFHAILLLSLICGYVSYTTGRKLTRREVGVHISPDLWVYRLISVPYSQVYVRFRPYSYN